jgi:hypothetical protein
MLAKQWRISMIIKMLFFSACLLTLPMISFAQSEMVTTNVLYRVFLIKYGDLSGSSFTIDVDNRQYLISAKHLLIGLKATDNIEIYHESQWKKLEVKRIDLKNPKIDILVMAPALQLSPPLELQASIDNLFLSQTVFFLGFPFGMNVEAKSFRKYFPMPFVKKGIVSAMEFEDKEEKILYVDGYNNPGFSGGPIVYKDLKDKKLKVAAVVSGYRNQLADIYEKDKATALKAVTNSGILLGYAIDSAIDAIKNNPIGVEIKSK